MARDAISQRSLPVRASTSMPRSAAANRAAWQRMSDAERVTGKTVEQLKSEQRDMRAQAMLRFGGSR